MKRICTVFLIVITLVINSISSANAALTWSQSSTFDSNFDGSLYNAQYDLEYTSAGIFDNSADEIYFYLEFAKVPTVNMFNTGNGAYGAIYLDYDFNDKADFVLFTDDVNLKTDSTSVPGIPNSVSGGVTAYSNCALKVFGAIAESKKWIGFSHRSSFVNYAN